MNAMNFEGNFIPVKKVLNPSKIKPYFLLSLLIMVLAGCSNRIQETALRPFYGATESQTKVSKILRQNCLHLQDSLKSVKVWKTEHYALIFQKADSLVARVEAIKFSLERATTIDNDLKKYPLSQLPPLHDSLTHYESQLMDELCKNMDSTVYFSNEMADLRELYLFTPNAACIALLTKIQAEIYLVLRNYYTCELNTFTRRSD